MSRTDILLERSIPTLHITSVERTLPTYAALGFEVAWQHQPAPQAPRLTAVRQGPVEVFLTEHPVAPAGGVVYFETQGLDAVVERAAAAGLMPTFGPADRPWGTREAYFRDPDGNTLRFGERIQTG